MARSVRRLHRLRRKTVALVLCLSSVASLAHFAPSQARAADDDFALELVDGKTLDAWVIENDAEVEMQDGAILLKAGDGWLRSHGTYADFKLHVEWKALKAELYDAGIYLRASAAGGKPFPKRGYQANMLQGKEGNIGNLPGAESKGLIKPGEWNTFDITAVGETISMEINGKPAWKVDGAKIPRGHVGLQVEVPKGGQFLVRSFKVTEIGFRSLFNGKDLAGWEGAGQPAELCWAVEDGLLTCLKTKGPWLRTKEEYGDFNFRIDYRLGEGANSGVYVRVPADGNHHRENDTLPPAGFEVQMLDDAAPQYKTLKDYQYSASVYDIAGASPRNTRSANQWNTLEINCRGQSVSTIHNGVRVTNVLPETHPLIKLRMVKGFLGLQNHGGGVWFRNVRVGPATPEDPDEPKPIGADQALMDRCVGLLRNGVASNEFWPAMHAAEGLTQAGHGGEVIAALTPKLKTEQDLQKRCGLARELVRAGDRSHIGTMLDILADKNPHGHVHACESLFKVYELGDGKLLREAAKSDVPGKTIMASAALARSGNPAALAALRKQVADPKGEVAGIAAWALGRVGDASDIPALRAGVARFDAPATRCFFEHALAALGDAEGRKALVKNLSHADPAVRTQAAEFAPDARALEARDALVAMLKDEHFDAALRAAQALVLLGKPQPPDRREEFARDVYVATKANPRYSEGTVFDHRDGRLSFITTEFFDEESDFAKARLIAKESTDEGRTWGMPRVVQENTGKMNVISASLRRLGDRIGDDVPVGLFYLETNSFQDLPVFLRVSTDDGKTFGKPQKLSTVPGYHCVNNDRIVRLASGRLLCPAASTDDVMKTNHFRSYCFLSDDDGKTWRKGKGDVDYAQRGAMEPEVLELADGRVLMHFRNQLGHIAVARSSDGGETWTKPEATNVRAPESPATMRRIPSTGDLLLVWNDAFAEGKDHGGKRTPLTVAISTDEGKTWTHKRNIDQRPDETYAYTSVLFHRGRALLSYYVGNDKTKWISSRFRSIPVGNLYGAPAGAPAAR